MELFARAARIQRERRERQSEPENHDPVVQVL